MYNSVWEFEGFEDNLIVFLTQMPVVRSDLCSHFKLFKLLLLIRHDGKKPQEYAKTERNDS